jgi:hypothetical protein
MCDRPRHVARHGWQQSSAKPGGSTPAAQPAALVSADVAAEAVDTSGLNTIAQKHTARVSTCLSVESHIGPAEPVTEEEIRLIFAALGDTIAAILQAEPAE